MVNFPDIEKIEKNIIKYLNQCSTFHEYYSTNNKLDKAEYTKSLRRIYNEMNKEIDLLRKYNNEVEKNNRENRNKKKGIETKPKKQTKKNLKGGVDDTKLNQEDTKLNQEDTKLNQEDTKFNYGIFKICENENNDDTIEDITELEQPTQKGGRGRGREKGKKYGIIKKK